MGRIFFKLRFLVKLLLTIYLIIIQSGIQVYAQDDVPLPTINIMSPNAASLGKYIDYPVNHHTGIPNIEIPIYEVKDGPLTLPISLSYHAGGLKVLDVASSVGTGWTLNAGGAISRTVKGQPDEFIGPSNPNGFRPINYSDPVSNYGSFYENGGYSSYFWRQFEGEDLNDIGSFVKGWKDGEPDIFFFSFNGFSGKFYIDEDKQPMLVPESDLKIEVLERDVDLAIGISDYIQGFKVITPDGTKYYFGIIENQIGAAPIETSDVGVYNSQSGGHLVSEGVISSWFLTKIESADSKFSINFQYDQERYSYYTMMSGLCQGNCATAVAPMKIRINGVRLSKISFSNGGVNFIPDINAREDLTGATFNDFEPEINTEAFALKSIEIESNGSEFCKRFDLNHTYFVSSDLEIPDQANFNVFNQLPAMTPDSRVFRDHLRLKLNSIQEISCDNSESKPPFEFQYLDEHNVPRRISFGQDHWGYYNGKKNSTLLPTVDLGRESSWPFLRAGTLNSITYPTGGQTQFIYEPNEVLVYTETCTSSSSLLIGGVVRSVGAGFGVSTAVCSELVSINVPESRFYFIDFNTQSDGSGRLEIDDATVATIDQQNQNFQSYYYLDQGWHYFKACANADQFGGAVLAYVHETINAGDCGISIENKIVGGVRIKRINQLLANGELASFKTYEYEQANLYSIPNYEFIYKNEYFNTGIDLRRDTYSPCRYYTGNQNSSIMTGKSASSTHPMITTQGYHIGYNSVKEIQADGAYTIREYEGSTVLPSGWNNLKDVSVSSIDATQCLATTPVFPPVPLPYNFTRGSLRREVHFDAEDHLLNESRFSETYVQSQKVISGISIAKMMGRVDGLSKYQIRTARLQEKHRIDRVYNPANINDYVETEETTYYESDYHTMPTRTVRSNNVGSDQLSQVFVKDLTGCDTECASCLQQFEQDKLQLYNTYLEDLGLAEGQGCLSGSYARCKGFRGGTLVTNQCFASDWPGGQGLSGIETCRYGAYHEYLYALEHEAYASYINCLKACNSANNCVSSGLTSPFDDFRALFQLEQNNQIATPIEAIISKNGDVIESTYNYYQTDISNQEGIYLTEIKRLEIGTPIPEASFDRIRFEGNTIELDPNYASDPEISIKYKNGQISEITDKEDVKTSYIWGYNNNYPIIKAIGTDISTLENSFITNPDGIRDDPALQDAQITTYDYDPLFGLIEQVDQNNVRSTYYYDDIGRLIQTKDLENNITQEFKYNFSNR
ncbi:MAG: hypothetical protein AAF363_10060 [Bacteroidota bacterium]